MKIRSYDRSIFVVFPNGRVSDPGVRAEIAGHQGRVENGEEVSRDCR